MLVKKNFIEILFISMLSFCFFRFKFFAASHLVGICLCFLGFLLCSSMRRMKISSTDFLYFSFITALAIISFYISQNPSGMSLFAYILNYTLPVLYILIADSIIKNVSTDFIITAIKKVFIFLRIYLFIEIVTRLINISKLFGNLVELYIGLKQTSIAYSDCNFLGLFILMIFCLSLYLWDTTKDPFFKKMNKTLFFFGFTSISRSVMLTMITISYLRFLFNRFRKGNLMLFVLNILAIPSGILILYNFLLNDASFRSKIGIMQGLQRIYDYNMNNILFGFGHGVGEYAYSYIKDGFGHLHIALYLGMIGIVGLVFFVFWLMRLNYISNNKCITIIFAFILSGFSLAFVNDSSFFLVMAIITELEFRKRIQKN